MGAGREPTGAGGPIPLTMDWVATRVTLKPFHRFLQPHPDPRTSWQTPGFPCWHPGHCRAAPPGGAGRTLMSLTFTKPQFLKAWLKSPRSQAFSLTLEATNFRGREHFEMKQKVTQGSNQTPRPALGPPRQPLGASGPGQPSQRFRLGENSEKPAACQSGTHGRSFLCLFGCCFFFFNLLFIYYYFLF